MKNLLLLLLFVLVFVSCETTDINEEINYEVYAIDKEEIQEEGDRD